MVPQNDRKPESEEYINLMKKRIDVKENHGDVWKLWHNGEKEFKSYKTTLLRTP